MPIFRGVPSAREFQDPKANELQDNIDEEAHLRQNADEVLQANIDAEAVARQDADTVLQANIDAERAARLESGSGAQGGGEDEVFFENDVAVNNSYTITTGKNAVTAGPVTINNGAVVTVPSGSRWSVV